MFTSTTKVMGLVLILVVGVLAFGLTYAPALAQPQPPLIDQPVVAAAPAAQTSSFFDLCADDIGTVVMPNNDSIPFWGFGENTGTGCVVQLPGPVLRVTQGAAVTVTLTNYLDDASTSIVFPGQTGVTTIGGIAGLFTQEAAANGGTVTYQFKATAPGTYLYESGTDVQVQLPMGLYGALIVDPSTPGRAYSDASTAYNAEEVLVLSEIDPALNNAADPYAFDLLEYRPTYWLLNGRAYGGPAGSNANPDVLDPDDASAQPYSSAISLTAGQRLLVRYINAGGTHDTMSLLGLYQRVIARDADELTAAPPAQQYDTVAETIPSGHTTDVIIAPPAAGTFPLYNRQFHITNGSPGAGHFFPGGGMMTFITVGP